MNIPWLFVGDLNHVMKLEEKEGGNNVNFSSMKSLLDMVHNCNLINLNFSGPQFTWTDMRKGLAQVQERLDRMLCNQFWLNCFLNCKVLHLPRTFSDNNPIMLYDVVLSSKPIAPFKVQAAWFHYAQFEAFLEKSWSEVGHQPVILAL